MGAIVVSIFVTLVALIGVIYFKYQNRKSPASANKRNNYNIAAIFLTFASFWIKDLSRLMVIIS